MAFRRITSVPQSSLRVSLFWLIVVVLPWSAAAQVPEPIRQALESNAGSLSPITVAWELTRTSDLPRLSALSLLKGETSAVFLPRTSRFMWDNGRFHTLTVSYGVRSKAQPDGRMMDVPGAPPYKIESESSFDGQKIYQITRSERDTRGPRAMVDTPTHYMANREDARYFNAEFFYQAGFYIPERSGDYAAKRSVNSLLLYLVEQGASVIDVGREEVDGVSCTALVLRSGAAENRFVLDPAKGYSVRRRIEKTPSGELAVRANCSDFTQVPGTGLWMPRKVEVEWHTWPYYLAKPVKEAVVRETFRVSELKGEPIPPEQFVLKFHDAGTIVADGTVEGTKDPRGRINYYVPADPSRLDEVIRAAASGQDHEPTISWYRRTLIIANVLLILILMGAAWWRVRRKPR